MAITKTERIKQITLLPDDHVAVADFEASYEDDEAAAPIVAGARTVKLTYDIKSTIEELVAALTSESESAKAATVAAKQP